MTQEESSTKAHEDIADAVDLEHGGIGASAAPLDPAGVASLGLNASTNPAITEALSGFLHEQRELVRRQCGVADKQSALLERRIERAELEKEHIEAQNHHLHLQHFHDKMRLVLDVGLATLGVALLIGIGWTVYGAITDRSIVVNTFTVAPKLESAGTSGPTVAAQWTQAEQTYAAGIARAPSLPQVYFSWGKALAGHRQYPVAIEKLAAAHERGPHWADPLKAWGDVLVRQGKLKEALAKYDEALMYAPNWKQLKEARAESAKQRS